MNVTAATTVLLRAVPVMALAVVLVWQAPSVISLVASAAADAVSADPVWLGGGLAAAVASMVAFGHLRQRTLRAAGARVSLGEATALTYSAGALHLTAPAGTVVSTGHVFRRLQRAGVRPAAIAYSLAVSGLVGSLTLGVLGATGILINGSTAGSTSIAAGIAGAVGIAAATTWVVRRPQAVARLAETALVRVNRVLRRPPEAGVLGLRATFDDLRDVRATGRDWAAATVAATANWLLDLGCLWACAHAVGLPVSPLVLLTSYAVAMAGVGVSPLPGGLGVVDAVLVLGLTTAGAPATAALGAVLLYRLISNGSVIVGGWTAVAARTAHHRLRRPTGGQATEPSPTSAGGGPLSHAS